MTQAAVAQPIQPQQLGVTIGKNTLFGMVSGMTQVGTRFITIPIVIAHLGLGGYGVWAIIMSMGAYMRFGSVGVKCAFQKYVAEATGNGDYETANRLLSTGCVGMLVLSLLGLAPIAFFSRAIATAAGVPTEFITSAAGAVSVLAVIMVLSNVGAVFEATVMGGHRIDLARRFTTFFCIAEAIAIIILLHFGYGLFAMATVMGLSEVGFIACCFFASGRIVPEIRLSLKHFSKPMLRELLRFAGSYQLVSVLQVIYSAILPIAVMRTFGAEFTGMWALASRLLTPASMLQDSFLLPILSGGSMIYASGSTERMQALLHKAFKVTLIIAVIPLAGISAFGAKIAFAWTGERLPSFTHILILGAFAVFFSSFSQLGLVLYRVTGRALMDNLREVLRILLILPIAAFAHRLGFFGVLWGVAFIELAGMSVMMYALKRSFHTLRSRAVLADFLKLSLAATFMVIVGLLALHIPLPTIAAARLYTGIQLAVVCAAVLLAAWPALAITRSISAAEARIVLRVFLPKRYLSGNAIPQSAR